MDRKRAAANALASVRLEGLDPGRGGLLVERWARGELTDKQLAEGKRRLIADENIDDLLLPADLAS